MCVRMVVSLTDVAEELNILVASLQNDLRLLPVWSSEWTGVMKT